MYKVTWIIYDFYMDSISTLSITDHRYSP